VAEAEVVEDTVVDVVAVDLGLSLFVLTEAGLGDEMPCSLLVALMSHSLAMSELARILEWLLP